MKLSKNYLYWLLQIIGWGIPFLLNAFAKLFVGDFALSTSYIFFETASIMFIGIAVSHFFRYVFKYCIKWKEWSWTKFFLTAILLLFCATIMSVLVEVFCSFWYQLLKGEALERSSMDYFISYANSFIYLLFWLTLYLLINFILSSQQIKMERLKLENIAKESQLNILKGQINPHFMFNSLNNIRGLMLEDVDKARDMLTQLSEMLRFSLSRKDDDYVPLREEVAVVRNYIALSKIQLEERLQYEEIIAPGTLSIEVPPMLIQMLIENAIKHGINTMKAGGKVTLEIEKKEGQLIIQITNDGSLTGNKASTKIGIHNIQQRLKLLYNHEASFTLTQNETGVIATVQIPV
ncbi:sensor histidine kinase [Nonlabens antarcticus]|uniref:sensor histidine kinase n=1 Tax=Nonlabens antarcticus TaxID=392714 RepID=UPI001891148E|nr:histidine kinase [Nonlabens antarcticus]